MRRTKEEASITIKRIMDIAKQQFREKGYAHVTLEDIVKEANLTRGAIYHHFKNKKGLFLAVFEEVQMEIANKVEAEAEKSDDLWVQLLNGCRAFIDSAAEDKNQRILLIDGPAVLGWDTFRRMDQKYSMSSLKEHLHLMLEHGVIVINHTSIDALTHSLSGAMNEAALWIAENPDHQQSSREVMYTIESFLTGFKPATDK
ncbi:TetR family transcriptional regulator [Ornithinibacillus sp. L9]|uniref:TetR family transcriptional regulator n=1 Tax=Ornithinibacillus caprae TaxID=2678566 RepID=A0A6N8FP19_9BACI|nr:TetR/AcrR family transcriptional regulator [Ornithinibacillus caprae]MUK90314.1 TetR family transcriptional regulator [Ornithinibacillus caprae]